MTLFQDKRLNNGNNANIIIHTLLNKKIDRHQFITYHNFIKSDYWKIIKEVWYKKYGKSCKKCNSSKYIQLHHIVYPDRLSNKMGQYLKVQDKHFISLCRSCHFEFHDINGVHQDMITNSVAFIGKANWSKIFSNRYRIKKVNRKKRKKKVKKKPTQESMSKRKGMSANKLLSM